MNSKALTSLTFGILSLFIPIVGLILGLLGVRYANLSLTEISSTGEDGRNVALSGKVCSIVGLCIQIGALVLIFLSLLLFNFTIEQFEMTP
ncbi:DUF4190 domain-containing protein [Halobacillus yeomjeoni]|uniref:DUF4190 domain-containing protein n=1 Tax=Halobacillus yeomjeoni TaxID=311194 RepID=A0A931HXG1_9BACI|nr:DUF4190 domain-containing protein [Halobacillus yeomjeoni]MBH0231263.1 DUF4190 domain-containing protein [Halobacillus yeomjeoni]MCA0984176.1 DUF4190 domain-containing protein [Halobacillus yeomjeoni]